MKYFLDTKFIEGYFKPICWMPTIGNFNKPKWEIQLISIGIVCEDGREYYAISNEFNPKDANDWVKENVLSKLEQVVNPNESYGEHIYNDVYKSVKDISEDIIRFVNPPSGQDSLNYPKWNTHLNKYKIVAAENRPLEFYAYYADYDWVLLCTLFGSMMDLPKGFPMYCNDLKQTMEERTAFTDSGLKLWSKNKNTQIHFSKYEELPGYPKNKNDHNALDDAKWNKKLYEFIQTS